MSVTPSPIGGFAAQFFDNNGVILSGGKIYTYAAGTTTPQITYTSASGTTAHTNPIILDSAGRVPGGEIWLTDGLVYKFVIETATSILLGTYDNITGVNSNFVNYTVQEEVITATAGQTVFNLTTINYTPGTNSLTVYIDGVNQYVGDSYLETDSNTVTFTSGVHVGGEVKFTTAIQTTSGSVNASIVVYDPPFTGAVATNVEDKLAQTISVKDFGAVGDGIVDDTAAIQAAIDAVQAAVVSGTSPSGVFYGTAPTLFFPSGQYKVTSALTADNVAEVTYLTFRGENSAIIASAGITIFGGLGYMVSFDALTFRGGAIALSYKTNNVDTNILTVTNCEFNNQTTTSIRVGSNCNSSTLNIENTKFTSGIATGYLLELIEIDYVNITNSWLTASSGCAIYNGQCVLTLNNVVGVPINDMALLNGRWIDNYKSVRAINSRFGAEFGGAAVVYNYSNLLTANTFPYEPTEISFIDCEIYGGSSSRADRGVIVAKTGLPATIKITGCTGPVDAPYINDQIAGGLAAWMATYQATTNRPALTINVTNTASRGVTSFGLPASVRTTVAPYLTYEEWQFATAASPNLVSFPAVSAQSINTPILYGTEYTTFTASGTKAVVDTGIFYGTANVGYSDDAIYDVYLTANPNSAGSGLFRAPLCGTLVVGTSFSGAVVQQIFYQDLFKPNFTTIPEFTVTAAFWDGATETTTVPNATANAQIRINVDGFTGTVGSSLSVRLVKRL